MEMYQDGDMEAFNEIFGRYERKLYNFFLGRLRNTSDCDDLYQKTFLKLHKSKHRYDPRKSFKPWFFTIAYNVLRDEFKRPSHTKEVLVGDEDPAIYDDVDRATPEKTTLTKEMSMKVQQALASLPEDQRDVIRLSKFELLNYKEIGRILSRSENAVKQLAHRGYQNLIDNLSPYLMEVS